MRNRPSAAETLLVSFTKSISSWTVVTLSFYLVGIH